MSNETKETEYEMHYDHWTYLRVGDEYLCARRAEAELLADALVRALDRDAEDMGVEGARHKANSCVAAAYSRLKQALQNFRA